MKRILLFVLTNIAVVAVLGIVASLLGVNHYLTAKGLNFGKLLGFALIMGFTGAILSLLLSKSMAKWLLHIKIIERPRNAQEACLLAVVHKLARRAGIGMPEVGIYVGEADAFATGAFRNSALVAVSTELLRDMPPNEIEAMLAHQIASVANGDMVTLTLLQGVMNTFVMFMSRAIGYWIDRFVLGREVVLRCRPSISDSIPTVVLDILLGFLGLMIVAWYSRQREFRADLGAAQLLGNKQPMIDALDRLIDILPDQLPESLLDMKIEMNMDIVGGLGRLFSGQAPLGERIAALEELPRG